LESYENKNNNKHETKIDFDETLKILGLENHSLDKFFNK